MGWYFEFHSRRDAIERLTTKRETRCTLLKHCLRGNVLWTVWELPSGKRFVGCDLLQNGGERLGWGYKPMDWCMGPCYYTCPKSYITLALEGDPDPPAFAKEWIAAVMEGS